MFTYFNEVAGQGEIAQKNYRPRPLFKTNRNLLGACVTQSQNVLLERKKISDQ